MSHLHSNNLRTTHLMVYIKPLPFSQLKPITRNIFQMLRVPLYIKYISAIFLSATVTHTHSRSTVQCTYKSVQYVLYTLTYYTQNSIFIFIQAAATHFKISANHFALHILYNDDDYDDRTTFVLVNWKHCTQWKINDSTFKCFHMRGQITLC